MQREKSQMHSKMVFKTFRTGSHTFDHPSQGMMLCWNRPIARDIMGCVWWSKWGTTGAVFYEENVQRPPLPLVCKERRHKFILQLQYVRLLTVVLRDITLLAGVQVQRSNNNTVQRLLVQFYIDPCTMCNGSIGSIEGVNQIFEIIGSPHPTLQAYTVSWFLIASIY